MYFSSASSSGSVSERNVTSSLCFQPAVGPLGSFEGGFSLCSAVAGGCRDVASPSYARR
jgi:hypothetical protein